MVSVFVDGEEPYLEASHVEVGMECYVGAGCHMIQKRERVADSGVGLAA